MPHKNHYVISYDIVNTKKRNKVADVLKNHGSRMQKSVFECHLNTKTLEDVMEKLGEIIDKKDDTILIYMLCEACVKQNRSIGIKPVREDKDYRVL